MTTPQSVEEIAGEIWRCIKKDFEKQGVQLPAKWNGIDLAYGGYVRAGEIMQKALDARYEEGVKAERKRVREWAKSKQCIEPAHTTIVGDVQTTDYDCADLHHGYLEAMSDLREFLSDK